MEEPNAQRTHEPSLREVVAELDGLRKLMDERDKWYGERDKDRQTAVDKALAAADKQTVAAFLAAKEAVFKAEEGQKSYNATHNDIARKMDEQNKATMPRTEIDARFQGQEEKIGGLKEAFAKTAGATEGTKMVRDDSRANLAIAISFILLLLALASSRWIH